MDAIIIVENDVEMLQLLADGVEPLGYRVIQAANAYEAFERMEGRTVALAITDLHMPGGGLNFLTLLRHQLPTTPIIVLTGFGDYRIREEVLKRGATVYFEKPVRLRDLRAAIDELLTTQQTGQA